MLKELIESALGNKGIYVSKTPTLVAALRTFLHANDINIIFDVGAYNGAYCRLLRDRVGYRGQIVSFEPCAESFRSLAERMRGDKNWRGFRFGLSDTETTATLNKFSMGEFNSILNLKDTGISAYELDSTPISETIQLRTLETTWQEVIAGIDHPRCFLKIDTQGHDLAVAHGAANVLPFIHGIQSELPSVKIYEGMKSMPQALQAYADLGFVPFGFYPVSVVPSYGSAFEFDVLLRRPPALKGHLAELQ
jgi:FkbM family methyltransferase